MTIETYLLNPLQQAFSLIHNRLCFGSAARNVYYRTDLQEVKYVGQNGQVYTILQETANFDQYIYDASWTPDGKTIIDITDTLRSLCGPMGNLHGYPLTLETLSSYLASVREDCDIPWNEDLKLTWTSSREMTTYEVTDKEEILDFDQ